MHLYGIPVELVMSLPPANTVPSLPLSSNQQIVNWTSGGGWVQLILTAAISLMLPIQKHVL